jgi:ATP-dependent Clp protease ATP-binding subunit ClpC
MAMFERFTERARKVILLAKEEARRYNHDYVGTEHILLGLLKEGKGVAAAVLNNLGLGLDKITLEIEKLVQPGPSTKINGDVPFTARAKKVIEMAMDEARNLGHNYIGTEHLLLGLIAEGEGVASQVLMNLGLDLRRVRQEVMNLLGSTTPGFDTYSNMSNKPRNKFPRGKSRQQQGPNKTPALDAFGRDLTSLARENKLDPVIGREKEINRVIQILSRRTKNNPVLLGEAGVGKTAIVEGLAQKIVKGDIPEILKDKRVVILDLALMVAGTKYRGQFEERIKAVLDEIKRTENVIIFIDELHTLVGAGGAEGAIDASNILKPALARGEIQCIGATTLDEYRKNIEKDAALERRFQTIIVAPPSVNEAIEILKGLRDRYEAHHRVKISDEAIEAAVKLSDRYVSARFLPDKAIDVIDEAGSKARLSVMTAPPDLKQLENRIKELSKDKEAAVNNQDFEKAAKYRDDERKAKEDLERQLQKWRRSNADKEIEIAQDDIAQIIADWTGIPISRLEEKETERLLRMEDEIHKRVVGQDEAVFAIANAVRRSRAGLKNPRRPIGSFVFLGPTGVGKTLLARALAEFMFGDEDALIQLDMSEYMEKFNVSRLVGAPPGYVGYEEGGQLTERVRRKPYSVVLLDEIEKAHPDVFNMLLQVLEEGRLTDSFGRQVDFRNTIMIMTSNIGANLIKKRGSLGFKVEKEGMTYDDMKSKLDEEIKKTFKPEFLNRIDDVIVFHALSRKDLEKIVEIEVNEVKDRLKEQDVAIELTKDAKEFMIEKGFDVVFGARPLKRTIARYLEDPLAQALLKGEIDKSKTTVAKRKGDRLVFESKKK